MFRRSAGVVNGDSAMQHRAMRTGGNDVHIPTADRQRFREIRKQLRRGSLAGPIDAINEKYATNGQN